jgi:hypothetical protein
MSRSKSLTSARLNDLILGCFGLLQPSDTLDHLVRYLGTWSGSELRIMSSIDYKVLIKYLIQQAIYGEACIGFRKTILNRVGRSSNILRNLLFLFCNSVRVCSIVPVSATLQKALLLKDMRN